MRKTLSPEQGIRFLFDRLCLVHGMDMPLYEFRFHPTRRWRFDYAWPEAKVAAEKVGGVWTRGHHSRGRDQIDDMEKRNEAQIMGWKVLEFTPEQFNSGEAFAVIKRALSTEECDGILERHIGSGRRNRGDPGTV
jgi:hypothetical protein